VLAIVGKSDVYILNRPGKRSLPCGTPADTGKYGEFKVLGRIFLTYKGDHCVTCGLTPEQHLGKLQGSIFCFQKRMLFCQ